MPTRVLLADDHGAARAALIDILESLPGIEVVAAVADGRQAVRFAGELRPDVVLVDVEMPSISGLEATREILRANDATKVIAVSMHAESVFAERMLAAGASGYVLKDEAAGELAGALRAVVSGGVYCGSGVKAPASRR